MREKIKYSIELAPILLISLLPLFITLTYQINLYLTWEGAYRLYLGEVPYRDFGMPMGFCYWILPAFFFKLFGPTLLTLAKTQAFINIISGLSFRWILVNLGVGFRARFLSIIIFSLTFILGLYWPQYNHTVIVFQFVAMGFIVHFIKHSEKKYAWLYLVAASIFITLSIFTKQDGGGLALIICLSMVAYSCIMTRSSKPILITLGSLTVLFCLSIIPFLQFDFGYWFNYGQAPHNSRIALIDILGVIMEQSRWEKIYLIVIVSIGLLQWKKLKTITLEVLFLIMVLGILIEALVFQVTSYVPRDNNIFFHAFACAFIFYQLEKIGVLTTRPIFLLFIFLIGFLWSEKYWKYVDRVLVKILPSKVDTNIVSINTYILEPADCNIYADLSTWRESTVNSFAGVRMPASTIAGIDRFLSVTQEMKNPIILNMSELTPLAVETPYRPQKGPLWFHLGVGFFDRELNAINNRIDSNYYDVVLFESIPMLNNFYPFSVREKLLKNYRLIDSFEAPRTAYPGTIEVFSKKEDL